MVVVLSKFYAPYRHDLFSRVADIVLYAYSTDGHRSWSSDSLNNSRRLFTLRTRRTEYSFLWPYMKLIKAVLASEILIVNSLFLGPVWLFQLIRGRKVLYMTDVHPLYAPSVKLKIYSRIFSGIITNVELNNISTKVIPLSTKLKVSKPNIDRDIDVLFVNQLVERKNIDFMRRFITEASDLKICVIGDGTFFPELEFPNVDWVQSVNYEEMGNYYNASKVLCAPSYFDVWGLNVQEALMSGCYVLTTNNLGAGHHFAYLSSVFILNSFDESVWIKCVKEIVTDYSPPLQSNMSKYQLNEQFLTNAINILHTR